jgi:hypothetical protein
MATPRCCLQLPLQLAIQEKLRGDLKCKLLWGITDADLGCHPCNCPRAHKVNGVCDDASSCHTTRTVYKIMCETNCCNCFYIGKSQRYVKKQVQEHIGEVARLYGKLILPTNQSQQTRHHPSCQSQISRTNLVEFSLDTQTNSVHESQPL